MIKHSSFEKKGQKKRIPTVLITAGPTREPIDSVRYISNYSTGIMGYYLAKEAIKRKWNVILINGPVDIKPPKGLKKYIRVEKTLDMKKAVEHNYKNSDIVIMAAAVCDFRPKRFFSKKIKRIKARKPLILELANNPDILEGLGKKKGNKILIGFALETNDSIKSAKNKLITKNLDIIVLNELNKKQVPFGKSLNRYCILDRNGYVEKTKQVEKSMLSKALLDKAEYIWYTSL